MLFWRKLRDVTQPLRFLLCSFKSAFRWFLLSNLALEDDLSSQSVCCSLDMWYFCDFKIQKKKDPESVQYIHDLFPSIQNTFPFDKTPTRFSYYSSSSSSFLLLLLLSWVKWKFVVPRDTFFFFGESLFRPRDMKKQNRDFDFLKPLDFERQKI